MNNNGAAVRVGRATARRKTSAGKVWWTVEVGGQQCATVTEEQWALDGQRMLQAYDRGESFSATTLSADVPAIPRDRILAEGRDATLAVDEWTREQAANEYRTGGLYSRAVGARPIEQWPTFERELFAALYSDPKELPADQRAQGADWMARVLDQAKSLPEWDTLRSQTRGDTWASGIGASRLTNVLSEALNEELSKLPTADPQRLQEEAEALESIAGSGDTDLQLDGNGDPVPSALVQQAHEKAQGNAAQAQAVDMRLGGDATEMKLRSALREALLVASDEIDDVNGAIAVIGGAPGQLGSCTAPRGEVRRALEGNPRLRSIANIAGRLKVAARQKQRTKTKYSPEQVVDVELGAEVQRLLPSEAMLLASEETELLLYRRLLERQALQYRLEGYERRERGPVVLCVDGSGSMRGLPHEWAMGVALALLDICVTQKRGFALVHFDAIVQKTFAVPKPTALTLPQLLEMVSYFSGGGTSFSAPLNQAITLVSEGGLKDADVILLTDGMGSWSDQVESLKALGAAVYGVAISGGAYGGGSFDEAQTAELAGVANVTMQATDAIDLVFGI